MAPTSWHIQSKLASASLYSLQNQPADTSYNKPSHLLLPCSSGITLPCCSKLNKADSDTKVFLLVFNMWIGNLSWAQLSGSSAVGVTYDSTHLTAQLG
jgi:hypothetical protein